MKTFSALKIYIFIRLSPQPKAFCTFLAAKKISNAQSYITLDEIFSVIIGNNCTGFESIDFYKTLLEAIEWKNDEAVIFGKKIITKRKVAWYGDENFEYTYSNSTKNAIPWTEELLALKTQTSSLEDNMQLLKEAQVLFPNINAMNVSELSFAQGDSLVEKPVLIYQSSENLTDEDQIKLKKWIEKRLNKSKVEVYK